MRQRTLIFIDASCLVAAAGSPTGGSGYLLEALRGRALRAVTSGLAIREAERNLALKFKPVSFERFQMLQQKQAFRIVPVANYDIEPDWYAAINLKDRHIIGAALHAQCTYLLTFDTALAQQVTASGLDLVALRPIDFIKNVLPFYPGFR